MAFRAMRNAPDPRRARRRSAGPALRVSNGIAIAMLFTLGWAFGRTSGRNPWVTGISLVLLGLALVFMTMALGG